LVLGAANWSCNPVAAVGERWWIKAVDVFPVLEESETPSPLPEGSIPEAAEVETVPAVEEREFPIAIEEAKAVEVALEVEEWRTGDLIGRGGQI
jgi:hypothetical protein